MTFRLKIILIATLIAFNMIALVQGYSPRLVTFAELPIKYILPKNASSESVEVLLGRERHKGMEEMRGSSAKFVGGLGFG